MPRADGPPAPLTLDPLGQAVGAARRYVRSALADLGREDLEDSAVLGVSELVTNAAIHARTRVVVRLEPSDDGQIRVCVRDSSVAVPRQRHYDLDATTGRGLRLVESVSSAWGVELVDDDHGRGKVVWFIPAAQMSADGFAETDWLAEVDQRRPAQP